MNRRHFLKLSGIMLASLIACAESQDSPILQVTDPEELAELESEALSNRILVIGAGMAGLAAASELVKAGYQVLILEARDRVGGRLWTHHLWEDAPVDLGASWIHGVQGNPLTKLANEAGARRVATSYDRYVGYGTAGKVLSLAEEGGSSNSSPKSTAASKPANLLLEIAQFKMLSDKPLTGQISHFKTNAWSIFCSIAT
ncbi:MAG: FAD-dependent oxidoreductase [Deinococcales bacterium]